MHMIYNSKPAAGFGCNFFGLKYFPIYIFLLNDCLAAQLWKLLALWLMVIIVLLLNFVLWLARKNKINQLAMKTVKI